MKVLHLVSAGEAPHFREQINILEQKGISCDVVPVVSKRSKELKEDSRLFGHNLAYYALSGARFYPKVIMKTILNEYDLVHINSGTIGLFGMFQPISPVVITLWGSDLLGDRLFGQQPKITRNCTDRYAETIVMSKEMATELDTDAHVIPHGIDLDNFKPIPQQEAKAELGWDDNKKHVLFPYPKFKDVKRYPLAKEVVDRVDSQMDVQVKLQVVDGVPHSQIPLYMNAADLLLLTSSREGSPNTVKEAMSCNLPIVSTDVGDVRERLQEVSPSRVCDSEDNLVSATIKILDSAKRSNGRDQLTNLSLDAMGDQIIEVYLKAINEK